MRKTKDRIGQASSVGVPSRPLGAALAETHLQIVGLRGWALQRLPIYIYRGCIPLEGAYKVEKTSGQPSDLVLDVGHHVLSRLCGHGNTRHDA